MRAYVDWLNESLASDPLGARLAWPKPMFEHVVSPTSNPHAQEKMDRDGSGTVDFHELIRTLPAPIQDRLRDSGYLA